MTLPDRPLGRRAALGLFGSTFLALALAACGGARGDASYRGGRRRRRDDVPFWHREEQRD